MDSPYQIKILLQVAILRLEEASKTPRLDAELLLCHVLGKDRTYLFAYPEKTISPTQHRQWQALLAKRQQKIPIAYLIGQKEFWGMMLEVNEHTLIPRPETELLVEIVLEKFSSYKEMALLDLGTGTGAIALALAKEKSSWQIAAADFSLEALKVAKRNAEKNTIHNVTFIHSDWFSEVKNQFDIIVSNPPYLDATNSHLIDEEIRHEPRSALVADKHGLADIENIIEGARAYLQSDGHLFIEHGCAQGEKVRELFLLHGYQSIKTVQDLASLDRITSGKKSND